MTERRILLREVFNVREAMTIPLRSAVHRLPRGCVSGRICDSGLLHFQTPKHYRGHTK